MVAAGIVSALHCQDAELERQLTASLFTCSKLKSDILQIEIEITSLLQEIICHGITQCYLPPGSGGFPAFTPAEAGTRFSDMEGMQG